jgi:putative ABC transport system permease protein
MWIEDLRRDTRGAVRALGRNRAFALVGILTLALGVGANTAIFSVVHSVLMRPLPYGDADRIVGLYLNQPAAESPTGVPRRLRIGLSVPDLIELRQRTRAISHAGVSTLSFMTMTNGEETIRLEGARVSPDIFQMLGVRPLLGRIFDDADEALGAEPVVILSHALWRRSFAADRNVVGRTLTLFDVFARVPPTSERVPVKEGSRTYSVVGVMPEDFEPGGPNQFWIPFGLTAAPSPPPRGNLVARLADGVSPSAAAAEVGAIIRELHDRARTSAPPPAQGPPRYEFVRQQDEMVAPVKPALLVLMGAVGFVLLIACVNVANLVFARTASRQREIAIRIALGAGRGRVIRHLLTESVVLALIGGAAGTLLAFGGIRLMRSLGTTLSRMDLGVQLPFPRLQEIGIDATVLMFAIATSLATGVVCGLAPALRYSIAWRMDALVSRSTRDWMRGPLIVAEVAMAMILLVAGGLLIHSFVRLSAVDLGYDPSNVLTFQVGLPADRYPNPQLRTFAEALVARLRSVPGVRAAAYGRQLPFVAITESLWLRRTSEPEPPSARTPATSTDARLVSRDYLAVMGIRVIAGRGFEDGDGAGGPRVMLINETAARRDFPGENPIGRVVYTWHDSIPWQIVGIVRDVRQTGHDQEPRPQFFADYRQWPDTDRVMFTFLGPYYAVRIDGDAGTVISQARAIARELDGQAGLFSVASMDQLVANRISRPRMYAVLLGIFAAVAVALAAIGIYGVLAYSVAQRTREIGVRMALGARRAAVMRLVLGQSLVWTFAGISLGLAGAAVLTRYLDRMLFGLTRLDPATFAAVPVLFGVVAALASYVPARRATRVDPSIALRSE